MKREDIIRMAQEAGFFIQQNEIYSMSTQSDQELTEWIERFAAHVAKHTLANIDPSSFMSWQEGYEAGAFAEREACAEVCKKHADVYAKLEQNPTAQSAWAACIDNRDAIRARGNVATNDTSQERVDETTKQRHDTPPQRTWVGLTDGEYAKLAEEFGPFPINQIEAKLKEKNT